MNDQTKELSRQAGEFARRAMEIQAGHLADIRRRTSIWTVIAQPRFDGLPDLSEPDAVEFEKIRKRKKNKKKDKKAKKARKKARK